MGYSISWVAVKKKTPERLLQEMGLSPTGAMADYGREPFTGRTLPSGWFLLVFNKCEHKFIRPDSLTSLSSNCDLVAASAEEHVMVSTSEFWRNGRQIWRIEHDAQESIDHLRTSGVLPDSYTAIQRQCAEEQEQAGGKNADADYFFDIPLQTAKSIVGFKHDDDDGLEDDGFEVFKTYASSSRTKPWWKVW
nr:hypothetical protein [Desulfobacula sp.]